jgi:hypothetical protein
MKILLFVPSYNDTIMAHNISVKFLENNYVSKALIVDDSDDPKCVEVAKRIKHKKLEVVRRERSGKWAAWRLALERARSYDGLLEVDSDVEVKTPGVLISSLKNYDVVTANQGIVLPPKGLGRIIGTVYQRMHQELKDVGKFNMGGQVVALSKRVVLTLLDYTFFNEPVIADDHVVCLAAYVLGFRCTTVDCGLHIRLPSTLKEWIKYRSRHRGAIKWAEKYVALKTGKPSETAVISQVDFKISRNYFLKNLFKSSIFFAPLILMVFAVGSVLQIENQIKWSRLKGEKF